MKDESEKSELFLKSLPVNGGFTVPSGYFETLEARLFEPAAKDEEESMHVIERQSHPGFEVPDGYFDQLEQRILAKVVPMEAPVIPLFKKPIFMWATGIAASFLLVTGLFLFEPKNPGHQNAAREIGVEEVADQLTTSDLNEDLLCDAGWCYELELVNQNTDKTGEDLLLETDEEVLINEL